MLTIIITSLFLLLDIVCIVLGFIFAISPIALGIVIVLTIMVGVSLFMVDIPAYQTERAMKKQMKQTEMEEMLKNLVELAKVAGKLEYMTEHLKKEETK